MHPERNETMDYLSLPVVWPRVEPREPFYEGPFAPDDGVSCPGAELAVADPGPAVKSEDIETAAVWKDGNA